MNKRKNYKKLNIILISIIAVILLLIIVRTITGNRKEEQLSEEEYAALSDQYENEQNIETEKNMTERDRIDYYFSIFLKYIENGKYEKAYDLLYSEFKNNYFPSLTEFEDYVKKYFPISSGVIYDNIERLGNIYILWVNVEDLLDESSNNKFSMNVCIEEYGFNDYKISFSADGPMQRNSGND